MKRHCTVEAKKHVFPELMFLLDELASNVGRKDRRVLHYGFRLVILVFQTLLTHGVVVRVVNVIALPCYSSSNRLHFPQRIMESFPQTTQGINAGKRDH